MSSKRLSSPASVAAANLCIGCGVCALAFPEKVEMVTVDSGFITPVEGASLTGPEQKLFEKFCPGRGYGTPPAQRPDAAIRDPMWGPVVKARDAWAGDDQTRREGSSGGALTALVAYLLASGKVDAVVGTAASATDPYRNESVVIRDAADARRLSGSRYSPASPFQALSTVPLSERVAVVGKPCDIASIRELARSGELALPKIDFYLSFFCAGTPSWKGTDQAVESLGVRKVFVKTISYRGNGWPGQFSVEDVQGERTAMSYEKSWGTILNKHLHNRCKTCQDGMGVHADIVAADSWDADENGYPVFANKDGRSYLITRTIQGEALVRDALKSEDLVGTPTDLGRLMTIQPSQVARKKFAAYRALGFRLGGAPSPSFPGFVRWRWAIWHPITTIRQTLGSFKRGRVAARRQEK
jgi:coenzyme F420 hydrogenase subunit beta